MGVATSSRGSRWRTVLLTALFTATVVAVDAAPVSLPAPIAEVLGPAPAKAGFCASNAAFTGHLTASSSSTTALTRTTDPIVYAYISNVQAAWSCTLYYRYSGVTFNTSATLGTFRWGNLELTRFGGHPDSWGVEPPQRSPHATNEATIWPRLLD